MRSLRELTAILRQLIAVRPLTLSAMRAPWTAVSAALVLGAFLVAGLWLAWVASQRTGQTIEPGWQAFRYGSALLAALLLALTAFLVTRFTSLVNSSARFAIGVVAGLEVILFGVVWFSLVVMPFSP